MIPMVVRDTAAVGHAPPTLVVDTPDVSVVDDVHQAEPLGVIAAVLGQPPQQMPRLGVLSGTVGVSLEVQRPPLLMLADPVDVAAARDVVDVQRLLRPRISRQQQLPKCRDSRQFPGVTALLGHVRFVALAAPGSQPSGERSPQKITTGLLPCRRRCGFRLERPQARCTTVTRRAWLRRCLGRRSEQCHRHQAGGTHDGKDRSSTQPLAHGRDATNHGPQVSRTRDG